MLYRKYLAVISSLLSLLLVASCSDNPSSFGDSPPPVPPASSMQMDFSSFNIKQKAAEIRTVDNFSRALGPAFVMQSIVDLSIAVPSALFSAVQGVEPEFNDSGVWQWKYSHSVENKTYSMILTASRISQNYISWSFYVSNPESGLNNDLLFMGSTNNENTEGSWTYFDLENPVPDDPVAKIEWTVTEDSNVHLRLEIISDRNDYQGDYIEYTYNGILKNAVYFDSSKLTTVELQIDTDTQAGYIIAPDHNNGEKACWDESRQDIPCS